MMKLSINSSTTSRPRLASVAWTFLLLSLGPIPSPWNANFHGITSSSGSHGPFLFANAAANDVANDNNPIVISESNTEDGPNDDDASDSISDARDGDTSSQGDDLGVSAANDGHNRRSSSDNHNNNHRSNDNNNHSHLLPNDPALTPDSVVLITGAAGFLGSELALSLRRAYGVRKLLLVDHLGIPSANEGQYVPPSPSDREAQAGRADGAVYEALTEEELSLFEYKRQRAFRLFHELTASPPAVMGEGGRRMDDDAESLRFYRADMRPSIPEFFDFGEVPLLEGIFQSNPDITHVVHLADVPESVNQAVPRSKDSVKAGRMEGVLEELRLLLERRKKEAEERGNLGSDGGGDSGGNGSNVAATLPHFVYASTADVYDVVSTAEESGHPNPPPFREDKPITTPSTLRGASKLIDEVLASAYHSTHGIYSVGLRFFPVYGPWATPGTEVFDLVERVIAENDDQAAKEDAAAADSGASATNTAAIHSDRENIYDGDTKDYVFIDDAVDAILSAMQYRPPGSNPPPVVFNVGTGRGSTLHDLYTQLISHFPQLSGATSSHTRRPASSLPHFSQRRPTKSIASTHRSELHLGFRPQTPLSEGLAHTLAWHRDRTFPYGRDPDALESFHRQGMDAAITHSLETSRGDNGRCSPLDRECLRGAPVFPCASECRRAERCTPSAWDDVAVLSKMVTTGCDAVLYTVLLDDAAEKIPSASTAIGTDSMPYVGAGLPADIGAKTQVRCNIAFVSEASPLVRRLKAEGEEYLEREESGLPPLLRHGFWTVLPVKTPASSSSSTWLHAFAGTFALEYLPKVSPARFFGSSVRYAAYADSNLIIDNLPRLLKKMEDGPPVKNGSTSLMLAEKTADCDPTQRGSTCEWTRLSKNDSIQSGVYNMVRVALRGEILGGGLHPVIDSSFLIHSLREEESRLFRCDAYSEAAQWGASGDERSLEFIVSLHDLWSRAVSHWAGVTPWWRSYSPASAVESEEEGSANNGVGEEGNGGNTDDEASRRRLSESSDGNQGTFFGVLSTGENQFFTQIVPSESLGVVLLDEYHRQ